MIFAQMGEIWCIWDTGCGGIGGGVDKVSVPQRVFWLGVYAESGTGWEILDES